MRYQLALARKSWQCGALEGTRKELICERKVWIIVRETNKQTFLSVRDHPPGLSARHSNCWAALGNAFDVIQPAT
jgi:hypothetical protein